MCECGCTSGNKLFKMKAPTGWYVMQLQPGCENCCSGACIWIFHPEAQEFVVDRIEDIPDLPVIGEGEHCISMIKCGLDPNEAQSEGMKCFSEIELDNLNIDQFDAEMLGEEFWRDALTDAPSVIYPRQSGCM